MYALLIPLFSPLLVLTVALLPRVGRSIGPRLAPWAPMPALLLALAAPPTARLDLPGVLLGTTLSLDDTGRLFLLFTAFVWLMAGWFAVGWLRDDPKRFRFWLFFLAAQTGSIGLCLAMDAVSFYLLFVLMTFAAFGLVVHSGTPAARRAGKVYLGMAVLGEATLIVGMLLAVRGADSWLFEVISVSPIHDLAISLLVLGFGIKVGLPLLHGWLPLAHPVAPVPASAVLSGVMLKAGVLGWLRFLPLGVHASPSVGAGLMVAGVTAMFLGVAIGLMQRDLKELLAYSSVSQMGFLTLAVGAGLLEPAAWPWLLPAVGLYAGHHALAKSALFLGAGLVRRVGASRWMLAGLALPALALAGAPYTSGMFAKLELKAALAHLPGTWMLGLSWVLPIAAGATWLLMLRLLWLAARKQGDGGGAELGVLPWMFALIAVAAGAWRWAPSMPSGKELGTALVPLVTASGIFLVAVRVRPRFPSVPPGDFIVLIEYVMELMRTRMSRRPFSTLSVFPSRIAAIRLPGEFGEGGWPVAAALWLFVLIALLIALGMTGATFFELLTEIHA
ncbi:MAG: complex I subunit 5 family protein [Thiotrichales bacterium]